MLVSRWTGSHQQGLTTWLVLCLRSWLGPDLRMASKSLAQQAVDAVRRAAIPAGPRPPIDQDTLAYATERQLPLARKQLKLCEAKLERAKRTVAELQTQRDEQLGKLERLERMEHNAMVSMGLDVATLDEAHNEMEESDAHTESLESRHRHDPG